MNNCKEYLDPDNGYALLKLVGNMPLSSRWIEVPEGAECFIRMRTGLKPGTEFFFKDIDGDYMLWRDSNWIEASYDCAQEYIDEGDELLWSREQPKEQGLISGADAKLAWAKGELIQIKPHDAWCDIQEHATSLNIFDTPFLEFRRKPRTITLSLEIPAPFEPKDGELFYHLCEYKECGYWYNTNKSFQALGAWRTEEEIKQVVAAWRGGIKA